jgi:RHS repeat-associated protein
VVEAAESAWLGRAYVARVVGADADGDPVRYTLTAGPVGMAVDAATGVVTWQPTALAATPISASVRVTDGRGGEATVSFAVRVTTSDENRAPVVVSVPGVSATVGSTFAYDLVGRDPDGDPVQWDLVSGPQGMSVNAATGTLRWAPAHDQLGPVRVTVRARDLLTAEGTQTFTVTVSCANQPPVVASAPPTAANAGFVYLYAVRATDPENDPLTFTLDQAPAGMAFVPGTSLIRWVPTADQAGPQSVVVRVTDRAGNSATQSFSVVVTLEAPNLAPAVTSRPVTGAVVGRPYSYQVVARDPDGDALTYTLAAKPDGMTISPTGLVTWTPTSAAMPTVTVEVADGRGGVGVQSLVLTARANTPPRLAALPDGTATSGGVFRALARATDPEGDPLAFRLDQAPAGMTIDAEGRIRWTAAGPPRGEVVRVTAVDPDGLSDSKTFTVSVVADVVAPTVAVTLSHPVVRFGSPVTVTVRATDVVGVSGLTLTAVRGATTQPLALDAQGRATFVPAAPGRYTFVATATDPAGNVGEGRVELVATDPAATGSPEVSFTRLSQLLPGGRTRDFDPAAEVASVTYLTDVFGTVRDPDRLLDSWQAYVGRSDLVDPNNLDPSQPFWRPVASGTAEIRDGRIFTFDPTVLPNDRYTVIVVAHNLNGRGTVTGVDLDVTGNAKLGEFRLEFTDLNLPLNGIPVQVTRVYDTRDAAGSTDFGYGWTLGVADARIRETVAPGPGDGLFSEARAFKEGTKVYLNLPDGGRAGFTFKPVVSGGIFFFGAAYVPKFVADPGVRWKLEVDTTALRPNARGEFQTIVLPIDYNPDVYRLVSPDGLTYTYSQSAGLQRIDDRSGNSVTYTADGITHSGGRSVQFVRDGQGRVTSVLDPDGNAIRYAYTAAGDLASVADQMSQTTRFAYRTDRPHYLDEVRDPLGRRAVKTEYDAAGRVVAVTDANGNRTEQAFDPLNFAETVKDSRGNPTVILYNDRGNVVRTELATEFGPIVTQTVYGDPANPDKETTVVNPRGVVTSKTYDDRGNVLTETTPDGTTAYTFSAADKLLTVTDTLGRVTAYDYSPQGNLVRVVNALGDSSLFTYDGVGRVSTFADFAGNVTMFLDYCACGRPTTVRNPDGTVRRIETNGFSQVTKTTDESGNTTENEYDRVGRLVRVTDGEGHATTYEYQPGTANVLSVTDPLGNVTRYAYDDGGRKTRITDAEGGVTRFSYDPNGNLETVTDPVNNVTRFVYDKANRVKEEVDPLGVSKVFAFDAAGNKTEVTDRNGRRRTFAYDPMNRATAETWLAADGSVVRVIVSSYDKAGNLLTTSDPDAVLGYSYDPLNRVQTATTTYPGTSVPTVTLTYGYDRNGNRVSVADTLGVQQDSQYGSRNELLWRTMTGAGVDPVRVEFEYRANGERSRLERFADAAGTTLVGFSTYDSYKNGLSKSIVHANAAGDTLVRYDYAYDDAGRLVQETHHGDTYQYGYDHTSQLLTVGKNGSPFESFRYDQNGNRIAVTGPTAGTYQTGPGNRYVSDGTFTYTYDREGNTKTKTEIATGTVTEYFWDHRNRLVKVEERSAGGVILSLSEYAYDPQGRRIAQKTNGKVLLTVYDRGHAWTDHAASGAVATRFVFGDRIDDILARSKSGTGAAWYLTDKLGTVRELVGANGTVINTVVYTAFGQISSQTNASVGDRYTFTGRERVGNSEYYYRARYYNAAVGRFATLDPIAFLGGDINLYRYVSNAPGLGVDPSGLSPLIEVVAFRVLYVASGAAAGVLFSYFPFGIALLSCQLAGVTLTKGEQEDLLLFSNGLGFAVGATLGAGAATATFASVAAAIGTVVEGSVVTFLGLLFTKAPKNCGFSR